MNLKVYDIVYQETDASEGSIAGVVVSYNVVFSDQGVQGPQGPQGVQGQTGANGTNGTNGQGVPVGGTTGQVLRKASGTNYDTEWATGGAGGGVSSWNDLEDKPATFPPSAHTHPSSAITDFSAAASAAAPVQSVAGRTGAVTLAVADVTNAVATSDSRIAKIAANSITTAQGANSGGAGGTITLRGGITGVDGPGGNAGSINLQGSDDRSEGVFHGGSIDLSGFSGHGGSITSTGNSEGAGGSLTMSGNSFAGGSINTSGGGSGVGGSIDTSNDGGSINTRGTGSIGFGAGGTRTTLTGTATADRSISLPDASGTLALNSELVTGAASSASDVLGVSGSNITGVDAGSADRLVFWDDSASKLTYLEAGSGLSISGTTMTVTATGGATNLWIPASAWIPRTTGGCGVDSREIGATNRANVDELLFDTGTEEFAQALVVMPSNYNNSTITARFYWTAASGSGGVAWGISGRAYGDDDALDQATGTRVVVTDTFIAANDVHVTSATSAVTIDGTPTANKAINFQISREVGNASDTLGVDARLLGVEIIYTAA